MTEDISPLLQDLPGPYEAAAAAVRARSARTLRPEGALARLDEIASWLAGWQGTESPVVSRPLAAVFVADHGVASEGVSAYPQAVTTAMLDALRAGVATANVLARVVGAELVVSDVGVGRPTANLRRGPALDPERFRGSVLAGRAVLDGRQADLLVVGEMGIANTTAAAAVGASLFGGQAAEWVGLGTGVDDEGYRRKVAVVEDARERVEGLAPLEILRHVGGAELVAIAGAVVEARRRRVPVVLDGFVVTAAAAVLEVARPGALDHCLAGHRSSEPGHRMLLAKMGKEPVLDLGLRLGEGSGGLLAVPIVRMAAACVTDVGTFEERGLER